MVGVRCEAVLHGVHDRIERLLREVVRSAEGEKGVGTFLDVGCWDGRATRRFADALGARRVLGVDFFRERLDEAEALGVETRAVDLEGEPMPFADASVDVVVCNQVFEHLKQIYVPMQEIHRVLREGGWFVFSVPNLASLHNRALLAFGIQPTSIRVLGPHVRGFTHRASRDFVSWGGHFEIVRSEGVGMYPLPMRLGGRLLGRILPGFAHTSVHLGRRRSPEGPGWVEWMRTSELQTVLAEAPPARTLPER